MLTPQSLESASVFSSCSSFPNNNLLNSNHNFLASDIRAGGLQGKSLDSATITSHKTNKRFRRCPPEDDEDVVSGSVMVDSVKVAIWTALNHYAYEDAVFAAERFYAEHNTEEAAFLLATSLYRAGDKHRAYELLSRCHLGDTNASSDIRYLYGKVCCDLDEHQKAENILTNSPGFGLVCPLGDVENLYKSDTPSYALQLVGMIHQKSQRKELAAAALKRALVLNPFQWSSWEEVCRMKEDVDSKGTFFRAIASRSSSSPVSAEEESEQESSVMVSDDVDMTPVEDEPQRAPHPVAPVKEVKFVLAAKKNLQKSSEKLPLGQRPKLKGITEESSSNTTLHPSSVLVTPVMTPVPPSIRTPNNYASPQSSNSQLNMHLSSTDPPSARNSPAAKKIKSKPPFRVTTTANSASTPETPSARSRRLSEIPSIASSASSPQPLLRRSNRLIDKNSGTSVKENKTVNKQDEFGSDNKINRKHEKQLGDTANFKPENSVEVMDKSENNINMKKSSSPAEVVKKDPIVRKRKKEPTLTLTVAPVQEPLPEAPPISEQDKLTGLVMRSYCRFAEVVQAMHAFEIQPALEKLVNISIDQQQTPFYWFLKGRLHFEMLEYDKSAAAFAEMRRKDPYYIKGIDYYSVALWHLQREKDLAVLAKYLVETHRDAPETYIVYGNVFSLQREHETAIKMFRRALQLNPNYAYALALLGYEYVSLDEMEKASQCFRMAIHADPSFYNGWYGLGMIAYKQESYPTALANFKRALEIYPTNPIILVNVGVAQHALKQTPEALRTVTSAVNSFPNNPLCRFQRASILYAMGRLDEAMQELHKLKDIAPKESLVYFLMGKVSKRTDNTHMALMYFSKAMDLDPKGTHNQIKEAFNKLYGGVEDDVVPQRAASGTTTSTTYASEM